MRLSTLLLLAAPGVLLAQTPAEPADWRFAHPSATLVGGIRLRALMESPILAASVEQASAKDPAAGAMTAMLKAALAQVEEVRFSVLDRGAQQMDALLMVTGKLDPALVNLITQGKAQARSIDERTLLLGEPAALDEAVRRMQEAPALLRNRALLRGSAMAGHDFWIAGSLPDSPMTSALKLNLRGLAIGFSFAENVTFETALDAATPEMAEELIRAARAAESQQPDWAGLLQTSVTETTATFRVSVPRDRVLAAIREGTAEKWITEMGGTLPGVPGTGAALPPRPEGPKRDTVIIHGLEGGPREIPATGGK